MDANPCPEWYTPVPSGWPKDAHGYIDYLKPDYSGYHSALIIRPDGSVEIDWPLVEEKARIGADNIVITMDVAIMRGLLAARDKTWKPVGK